MATNGEEKRVRLWTPAPRGPRLARYVMCGECGPWILGTVNAFVLGTMGNWLLYGVGLYSSTVLLVVLLSTEASVLASLCFGSRYGNLRAGPVVDDDEHEEQHRGRCAEHD